MTQIVLEQILFGIVQGITEWLPISSEGLIVILATNLMGGSLEELVRYSLFLHLGTLLAAVVYLRKDLITLVKTAISYRNATLENKNVLLFLLISTLISGALGYGIFKILEETSEAIGLGGRVTMGFVGLMLLITGAIQLKKRSGLLAARDLSIKDGVLLGLAQGISIIPGISRSGITVATLLLRKFNDTDALKLSFLMSIPAVLGANIVLNLEYFAFSAEILIGLAAAFVFGLGTIHYLFKLSQKVNFAYFALLFGILSIVSVFV